MRFNHSSSSATKFDKTMKLAVLVCCILSVFLQKCCADPLLVSVEQGQLRGSFMKAQNGRKIAAFRGIPFAEPPVGQLRFQVTANFNSTRSSYFELTEESTTWWHWSVLIDKCWISIECWMMLSRNLCHFRNGTVSWTPVVKVRRVFNMTDWPSRLKGQKIVWWSTFTPVTYVTLTHWYRWSSMLISLKLRLSRRRWNRYWCSFMAVPSWWEVVTVKEIYTDPNYGWIETSLWSLWIIGWGLSVFWVLMMQRVLVTTDYWTSLWRWGMLRSPRVHWVVGRWFESHQLQFLFSPIFRSKFF